MERTECTLESLPDSIIIKIITDLLNTQDERIQSNIVNIGSIRIVNSLIEAEYTKYSRVNIVDFMDTRLWIRLLISIGIFDNQPHIKWCDTVKKYLGRIVRERRYTSRVHDLIDISKSSHSIRDYARCLLYHLITDDSDEIERSFLLGEMMDIPSLNNNTLKDLINTNTFNNIKYWDVRNVTVMTYLFSNKSIEVIDVTYWDTSNVKNMRGCMSHIKNRYISGITNWNTCRVKNMEECFYTETSFNQPLEWNTSNVTSMSYMFFGSKLFNQPLNWNTGNVEDMSYMFANANAFNQLLDWDTRKVINMIYMFKGATSFNQPLRWDTRNVTDMNSMFKDATSFNQALDWNITNVTYRTNMFENSQGRLIHP